MSRDELVVGGQLDALVRWGLSPKARQIRLIGVWFSPVAAAIERVDQCVAFTGCSSRVLTTTRSTSESMILRGWPGRGSSCGASSAWRANRPRNLPAVDAVHPSHAAMSLLLSPSAATSTIRHRTVRPVLAPLGPLSSSLTMSFAPPGRGACLSMTPSPAAPLCPQAGSVCRSIPGETERRPRRGGGCR